MKKLILTVGISGSGKSTYIKSLNKEDYIIVSPDNIRYFITGDISNQDKNKEVWEIVYDTIILALNNDKKNVILDATNLKSKERKKLLNLLKIRVVKEFQPCAKVFNCFPDVAKLRVKNDILNNINRSKVSDEVIDKQYINFIKDIDKLELDGYTII